MVRERWRRHSISDHGGARRSSSAALAVAIASALPFASASASAGNIAVAPSATGHFGAWLALGPVAGSPKGTSASARRTMATPLLAGDDRAVAGRLGQAVAVNGDGDGDRERDLGTQALTWRIASASLGPIDLAQSLDLSATRGEAFAYLYGVLHLERAFSGTLLLGSSDGVRVYVDRRLVWSTDHPRPQRDEEDAVPLVLAAGDHPVLIKLHRHDGAHPWALRTRLVNDRFVSPPGATLELPGSSDADGNKLAARMVNITVDHGLHATGFAPLVAVGFPEGMPRAAAREVRVTARATSGGRVRQLFAVSAGQIALTPGGSTLLRVRLPELSRDELEDVERAADGLVTVTVEAAGRKLDTTLGPRPFMHEALQAADRALAGNATVSDPAVTRSTIEHLRDRLVRDVGAGAHDLAAVAEAADTISAYADDLALGRDPLKSHPGIRRFAYRSLVDGQLSPFAVHVPRSFAEAPATGITYPLVVALHGMNGKPVSMAHWTFGRDDPAHDADWEDRRAGPVDPFDGFVVAPHAHGNSMYRELGEGDVLRVLDWAMRFYPIDPNRVSITGVSMGGTGAASIALRYPDRFAGAMPLCGYHSYFVRRDLAGKPMRSWERLLAAQRSNASWAENGQHLPMFVWHGKRDLPEANSGVLIDRYLALGYPMQHEHPDVGHDVWRPAYEAGTGLAWLAAQRRQRSQPQVTFRTASPRYLDNAWVHLHEVPTDLTFASIDAKRVSHGAVTIVTDKVGAFTIDRTPEIAAPADPVAMTVDGSKLLFGPEVPLTAHRGERGWTTGPRPGLTAGKRARLSGPIRDVFHEPLVFVYGTGDPAGLAANRETARHFARIRYGAEVRYPIIADHELDDALAATHALVLVGGASSNSVVRELDGALPFRLNGDTITASTAAGPKVFRGKDIGVAFVYPNPRHPERYLLVIEGTTALGTFRATALPELLPDFVVFGAAIGRARGQLILGSARALAAGLFRDDWSLGALGPE